MLTTFASLYFTPLLLPLLLLLRHLLPLLLLLRLLLRHQHQLLLLLQPRLLLRRQHQLLLRLRHCLYHLLPVTTKTMSIAIKLKPIGNHLSSGSTLIIPKIQTLLASSAAEQRPYATWPHPPPPT